MKPLDLRDTAEFRRGRKFEQLFARLCIERGHHVMRCYDLDVDGRHKAPMVEGPYAGCRLPDLQVFARGKPQWVECKEKTRATVTVSEGFIEEHGIGLRCFRDYRKIEKLSGVPVWLAVAEWISGVIFLRRLKSLGTPREYTGSKMDPGGMVFWPRDRFREWGRFDRGTGQLSLPYGGSGPFAGFDSLVQQQHAAAE